MTRTACAWCSRSLPVLGPALTLVITLFTTAPAALGTTYVPMSDADLADQASLVVEGRIEAVATAPVAGRPATDYTVEVLRSLKGSPAATPLTVRVPGGRSPDGAVFRVWGVPELRAGDRAILFLSPRGDGTLGIHQLMLGVFREEVREGRALAVRDLSEARAVTLDGSPARGESRGLARDFRAFAEWLAERGWKAAESTGTGPYFVEVPAGDGARLSPRYTLLGSDQHFRWSNGGGTWYAYEAGQSGMPGGGFSEFQAALGAWNADAGSDLSLRYGGTTSRSSGFRATDGTNVILFDDPNGEISGSFDCSSGGVLAIGGFSNVSGTATHNGETFWTIVEGEVVTQDGAGCYFSGNGGNNGELVFAHEVGHALGLGHSCGDSSSPSCSDPKLNDALMRAYAHSDGRGARLGSDDRAAVAYLYGDGGGSGGCTVPAAPDTLSASPVSSSRIDLTWRDRASDETSYVVERRPPGSSVYSKVATLAANTRSWIDTGLAAGTPYAYRVQAVGCGGASAWAGPASATTPADAPPPPPPPPPPPDDPPPPPGPTPPPAPTGLDARAPSGTTVVLSWTDRSGGTAATHVEVKTGAAFHEARVVAAGRTGTTFTGLDAGRTYLFRVRARDAGGYSAYSAPASVKTPAPGPPPGTLTAAQVACDAGRLAGLLDRLAVAAPGSGRGTGVNLALTGSGDFAGVAYTLSGPGAPERHLAFSTNPEETTLLRNPERKQLASVSLTRNHLASDLVGAGDAGRLRLTLNPTLSDAPDPAGLLVVENLAGTDRATSARPGRGLAPLVESCHAGFMAEDVHVFRVLEKVARAAVEGARSYEIAVYRAPAPDTYRLDVYPLRGNGSALGRFAVELRVRRDADGTLASGTLRSLGRCSAGQNVGCSTVTAYSELVLGRPTLDGTRSGATAPKVVLSPSGSGGPQETAVDWKVVLGGTTWRRPLVTGGAALRREAGTALPEAAELSAGDVACDADRLAGFLERVGLDAAPGARTPAVNVSYTGTGDFAGIAYAAAPGGDTGPHLAFSTNPEETTLLRNPERPQLASVSLTRNHLNSDLVAAGGGDWLRVRLNPTLAPGSGSGAGVLVIDNRDGATGGATDAKPGRGLTPLVAPCHARLSDRDVHVFRVLSKLVRARTSGAVAQKVAIYRGARPGVYRIDVYPQAPQGDWGRLAAELEVGFGPGDELRSGTLRLLAPCRPGGPEACTDAARPTELFLVAPAPPGGQREVTAVEISSASPAAKDSIDFSELLAGTTWKRPL